MQRLAKLPNVGGLVNMSTMLLPENLETETELREAAARLKADMLVLYTFDTSFHDNDSSAALTAISLGLSPTRKITVHVAATALVVDTRTGFIYAALESNEKKELNSSSWNNRETADQARRNAEKTAFKDLVGEFEKSWPQIVDRAKKGA